MKRARSPAAVPDRGGERGPAASCSSHGIGSASNRHTPYVHPPLKRARRTEHVPASTTVLSLEGSLSEEILLRCLSYLDLQDLMNVSRVSSAWHRLSHDPQLWRRLYLNTFVSSVRANRSLSGQQLAARTRPWRDLFKISTNWRRGNARSATIGRRVREAVLPEAPPKDMAFVAGDNSPLVGSTDNELPAPSSVASPSRHSSSTQQPDTILQFHKQFFFTTSRSSANGPVPTVSVHQSLPDGSESVLAGTVSSDALCRFVAERPFLSSDLSITEMRLDEASPNDDSRDQIKLAAFYSTGQFSVFKIALPSGSQGFLATELHCSLSMSTLAPGSSVFDPVVLSRVHWPLIVTCSKAFVIQFWRILEDEATGAAQLQELEPSLQTRQSWAPVALTLQRVDYDTMVDTDVNSWWLGQAVQKRDHVFKVTLAYSTPVFPEGWTVGVQEFELSIPASSSSARPRISARHATALPTRGQRYHSSLPPLRDRRDLVTSIEHSDPFIVTSRSDNTLDVYEVTSTSGPRRSRWPARSTLIDERSDTGDQLAVVHRRTLFGHTARVASVAIESETGKCVSAGDDGVFKIWQLSRAEEDGDGGQHGAVDVMVAEQDAHMERDEAELADVVAKPTARRKLSIWEEIKARRKDDRRRQRRRDRATREASAERISKVWFDEDKIVSIVARSGSNGRDTSIGEEVRVMRFD